MRHMYWSVNLLPLEHSRSPFELLHAVIDVFIDLD
jgi:hypothetical protein